MPHHVDRTLRWRQRRWVLTILALALLRALMWPGPEGSAAGSNVPPVYLPLIMRDDSTICFRTSGTYPIAMRDSLLNADGFVDPSGTYSDEMYQNKTWKRVYLHDSTTNPNGGFAWLRWRAEPVGGNIISFTASLTGTGNLGAGFDEALWPSAAPLPKPPGYPLWPQRLNTGDWVYHLSATANTTSVRAALDYHIVNKTLMVLPIYDAVQDGGVNSSYHIARSGAFLLRGYGLSGNAYLDLVYIEEPATVLCTG
jgi:hypothetical protein